MGKSRVSLMLEKGSKIVEGKEREKSFSRKDKVTFQNEYNNSVEQLLKVMDSLVAKEQKALSRKDFQRTNKSSSFTNKSMRRSKIIEPKKDASPSYKQTRTERSFDEPSKPEKIAMDLSDASVLACEDEIVNNLLEHLRAEEQRYVDQILEATELGVRVRIKTYMSRQCEKYEEALFKLKQEEVQKTERKVECNKETVRRGYTEQMKTIVEKGLRGRPGQ